MTSRERDSRFGAPAWWTIRIVAVVLVVWLGASVLMVMKARSRTIDGLERLDRARDQLTAAALLRGGGERALAAAREDFEAAHADATSVVLAPWSVVPLVNQNVESVDALTAAASDVAAAGEKAAGASATAVEASPASGTERLQLLSELEQISARAERELRRIDLGPDFFLFGPLGDARERFIRRLRRLRAAVEDAQAVARGAQQLLGGPRRYLIVAANNAEMRAGSGMLLSAGVAAFADGGFDIGEMRPTPEFNLPAGAVALPPDLAELWGWILPSQEWRNLATTPRFDVTAPLAAEMWRAATGEQVDGVLLVDPLALRGLLAAQGAVDVGGGAISAENVVEHLLLDQYAGLAAGEPEQSTRRDQLSGVARAAVDTLDTRPWDTPALLEELASVGAGRHVLAWARDPVEQRAWKAAGIDGALRPSSLAVSLLNVGANKLDQFVEVDARIEVHELAEGGHEAAIRLRIENDAPGALSGYVGGPDPRTDLAEGQYEAIVAVNGPGVGSLPTIEGLGPVLVAGVDGPTKAVAVGGLLLARGEARTVTLRVRLPAGFDALRVEASARIPPIAWRFGDKEWDDTQAERLEW